MIRAIVTDIEGTTSSISFVVETLFPYAHRHMAAFIRDHASDAEVAAEIDAVRAEIGESEASLDRVTDTLLRWIDEDRKVTPLKAIQGMIWARGYQSGELTGHVYADVPEALAAWKRAGKTLAVYSSGSVAAQKLIFGHTEFGDLTPCFSGYFDTTSGGKREAESYVRIAAALQEAPDALLFLSDIQQELDAARSAGWHTCGLERGRRGVIVGHPTVDQFGEIKV